ncbi:hypothetical protein HBI75_088290 [Parastagonospora nodorum]|nr:hypothetical protein HBH50_097780 [Parastagonospora nodorum]KAH4090915.1 hypothetical protein HBH48_101550 [Parastagonospora nodorum]KAH5034620.1 hypothetical protein HBI75_088290 [Parastagonospora nodorum]KAH5311009.1 hypothetical protein HBI11_098920 [Parastagonospora nodorum]KAH5675275.1 hypothetical protein HBI21_122320 [Parastagonospora nodorum]
MCIWIPSFQNLTAKEDAFTVGRLRSYGIFDSSIRAKVSQLCRKLYICELCRICYGLRKCFFGSFPASNNGLVAYAPSRGVLSVRGNWPLFSDAGIVDHYARTLRDLLHVLDVIVADDESVKSDSQKGQPMIQLPAASSVRPQDLYNSLRQVIVLRGKRTGVPKMFIC